MKRLLAAALAGAACLAAYAQEAEFQKAIKKNAVTPDGYYFVDLSKKNYSKKAVTEYAKNNGYTLYDIQEKTVSLYGNMATIVVSVKALPKGASRLAPSAASSVTSTQTARDRGGETETVLRKAFRSALNDGPDRRGVYGAAVRADITENEIRNYARSNGYHFLSIERYATNSSNLSGIDLKLVRFQTTAGMAEWVLKKSFNVSARQTGSMTLFDGKALDGITWSGQVDRGKISGTGYGAKFVDENTVFVVYGTFREGKLAGEGYYRFGSPDEDGFMRIAGGKYVDEYASRRTVAAKYRLRGAGEYARTSPAGEGIMRIERGNYLWDGNHNKPYTNFLYRNDKYVDGTTWYYIDGAFNKLFNFPEGVFEEISPFHNGSAVVRHTPLAPPLRNKDEVDWIEYTVSRSGEFRFTDSEKEKILRMYDAAMTGSDDMLRLFSSAFLQKPARPAYMEGSAQEKRFKDWDEHCADCTLDSPWAQVRVKHPDGQAKYLTYRRLHRLYNLCHSDDWNTGAWDMDSKVAYAMQRYEAMDYGHRSGFDPSRYLNPEWMAKRMQEGEGLINGLLRDDGFNPANKTAVLDNARERLKELLASYASAVDNARSKLYTKMAGVQYADDLKGEQIDTGRSTRPSELEKVEHVLGGHHYTYKNWGSIRFHKPAGNEEVRYNIQYDSDMKLEFYIIGYNTLGISTVTTYRTSKEMMAAILEAFNKKYH